MHRSTRHTVLSIAIISLSLALLSLWYFYATIPWLTSTLPGHLRRTTPVYMQPRLRFADGAAIHLIYACVTMIGSIAVLVLANRFIRRSSLLLFVAFCAVLATNVMVSRVDRGRDSFVAPYLRTRLEYFGDVPRVRDDPLKFVRNYQDISPRLSLHAGTHPPGAVLFLWAGTKLFGPSVDVAAWWSVVVGSLAVIPAYGLAFLAGGRAGARRALPLYVCAPSLVIFGATSMDAVFLTFELSAFFLCFMAFQCRKTLPAILLIGGAGISLWLASFLTFAVVLVPILVAVRVAIELVLDMSRKRLTGVRTFLKASGIAAMFLAVSFVAWLVGYDVLAVVEAAMKRDHSAMQSSGYESLQLWAQWSVGNLFAFLLGSGVALSAAFLLVGFLHKPRRDRSVSLAVTLAITLLIISVCTLFSFETERVWLFLSPAMIACVAANLRGRFVWSVLLFLCVTQTLFTQYYFNTWW